MRFNILAFLVLLPLSGVCFAQGNTANVPGYLVLREGDPATPLKFDKHKVYFEWENNDYAYASDWPSEGAFLVFLPDENETGSLKEDFLFGDKQEGYSKDLAIKDGNNDGMINSDDMVWSSLSLWSDKNSDGYAQSDELEKLSADNKSFLDRNKGELSFADKIYHAHAFLPYYDQINSRYVGEYILDIDTLFLPTLRGYATIPDLHIAASKDKSLKDAVIKLCTKSAKDIFSSQYMKRLNDGEFADIMYKWGGVDTIDPTSRGPYIDARELAILEKIMGKKFSGYKNKTGNEQSPDPNNVAARTLHQAWTVMAGRSYSIFMAQCGSGKLFVPPMKYDFAKDAVELSPRMATLQTRANIDEILKSMTDFEKQTFWITFEDFLKNLQPTNDDGALELIKALKGPPSMLTERDFEIIKPAQIIKDSAPPM